MGEVCCMWAYPRKLKERHSNVKKIAIGDENPYVSMDDLNIPTSKSPKSPNIEPEIIEIKELSGEEISSMIEEEEKLKESMDNEDWTMIDSE